MFTYFFQLLLFVATVNANLNLSHHRLRRQSQRHAHALQPRQLNAVNGVLGDATSALNGDPSFFTPLRWLTSYQL